MSVTTIPHRPIRTLVHRQPGWIVRLFDYKPFLIVVCLTPAIGLLAVFLTYPLGLGVWLAFTDTTIGRRGVFVGLENFQYLLSDPLWWNAVFYSVFYTAIATFGKFALGFWLALLLNNHFPFKSLLRAIILLPWIVPTVLSALAFWWIYDPQFSIISYLLVDVLHIRTTNIDFLGSAWPARFSLIAANIWRGIPFVAISLLAGLQTISPSLYEAAMLDGASRLAAVSFHHLPDDAADSGDRDDVLDHLHLYGFPAGLRHHPRRPGQLDASAGDAGVPARHRRRRTRRRCGDRGVDDPVPGVRDIVQLLRPCPPQMAAGREPMTDVAASPGNSNVASATPETMAWDSRARRVMMIYLPLSCFVLILLFPFYWMAITSFKPNGELLNYKDHNPFWITSPTHRPYQASAVQHGLSDLAEDHDVRGGLFDLPVAVCITLAAYAIERLRFRGSPYVGLGIYLAYLVPPSILFIPLATVVVQFGLFDSPLALILVYPTFLVPFCTWLLIGYFKSIPYELEECALVDGATRLQILRRITLPLAVPGLISAGIFSFTLSWNEFIYALAFIQSSANKTVPVAILTELVSGDVYQWGALMAGSLLGSLPVAVFYSLFVDYYVSSLTGAVKE